MVALSEISDDKVHILKKAQIAYLKVDKAFSKMLNKYADFANVFLLKLAAKILEHIKINNLVI